MVDATTLDLRGEISVPQCSADQHALFRRVAYLACRDDVTAVLISLRVAENLPESTDGTVVVPVL